MGFAFLLEGVLPFSPLKAPVDGDTLSLVRVVSDVLAERTEDVEVVGPLLLATLGKAPAEVAGNPQATYGLARWQRAQLGVAR